MTATRKTKHIVPITITKNKNRIMQVGFCTGFNEPTPLSFTRKRHKSKNKYAEDADGLLAKELNELSLKERENVFEEVHGVADNITETPTFVAECLAKLEVELGKLPRRRRKVLDRAMFLKPNLKNDGKFQLAFLRADYFDASKAAKRMCAYYDNKLRLFGESKLVKRITLDDMNADDMAVIETRSSQIVPQKDRVGRPILIRAFNQLRFKNWKNQARAGWHEMMTTVDDENAQIRGTVMILDSIGAIDSLPHVTDFITKGVPLLTNLPMRHSALHFCYDDPRLNPLLSLVQMMAGKQNRLRFRTHYGSIQEVHYTLMTFGISVDLYNSGLTEGAIFEKYLRDRRDKEAALLQRLEAGGSSSDDTKLQIPYPGPQDILLGRGRPYQEFPGNLRLGQTVDLYRDQYVATTDRLEKTVIAISVVQRVKESGARFLHRKEDGWEIADDHVAQVKVSQALRLKARVVSNCNETPLSEEEEGIAVEGVVLVPAAVADDKLPGQSDPKRMRYTVSDSIHHDEPGPHLFQAPPKE